VIVREVGMAQARRRVRRDADITAAAIGARVESLRLARGWTTAELARRTGLSRPFLTRLQAGRHPSLPNGAAEAALADVYGVTLDWIWRGAREEAQAS